MPRATPAAILTASICVLPDPAPASTRMLVCRSSRMRRRDSTSSRRESVMGSQLAEHVQYRVAQLALGLAVGVRATRRDEVAELAVVLVRRMNEGPLHDDLAQVA